MVICITFLKERESNEKLGGMKLDLSPLLLFSMQSMQINPALVLQSQQRLHILCFLHYLGCQKPCWNQARLSSLVNKQVDSAPAPAYALLIILLHPEIQLQFSPPYSAPLPQERRAGVLPATTVHCHSAWRVLAGQGEGEIVVHICRLHISLG